MTIDTGRKMATQTKVKQAGQKFWWKSKLMANVGVLQVLILVLCCDLNMCMDKRETDFCLPDTPTKCNFSKCICTEYAVECHNETGLNGDIVDLFDCIKDDVTRVVITGSNITEMRGNFLGSCKRDTSLVLHKLTYLDLSHNSIRRIHGKSLHCMPYLETLILAHNEWMIDYHTDETGYFTSLPALKTLDLSNAFDEVWNGSIHILKLATVFRETDMTKLETLMLADNELFTFSKDAADSFCELASLKTLDMSHNRLSEPAIPTGKDCIEQLEYLDLSYNRMPRLTSEFTTKLDSLSNLKEIQLGHNYYMCDCTLADTYDWLSKTKLHITDIDDIVCTDGFHSSYINKTVLELKASDLKCLQLPTQSNTAVHAVTGIIFTVIGVTIVAFLVIHRAHVRRFCGKWKKRLPSLRMRSHTGYNTVQEVAHL